jgi:hypothetical protein
LPETSARDGQRKGFPFSRPFEARRAIFLIVRGLATLFIVVCFVAVLRSFSPQPTSTAILDWPFGRITELPSPDGRHIVYGEPQRPGVRDSPELWLRHRGRPESKRLIELTATARVFWSPDSRHFVIVERETSNSMTSSIYDTEGQVVLEISPEDSDKELRGLATGHFYVEAQRFLDAHTIRVAAFGHTDEAPVRCFRFIYSVIFGGEIHRLSKRVSPATATACDETSE